MPTKSEENSDLESQVEAIESRLMQALSWGIYPVRFIGYYPYKLQDCRKITFSWVSWSSLWTCFSLLLSFFFIYYTATMREALWAVCKLESSTERFSYALLHVALVLFSISCKCRGYFGAKYYLRLWRLNLEFLASFKLRDTALYLECVRGKKYGKLFDDLRFKIRMLCAFVLLLTIVHSALLIYYISDWSIRLCSLYWIVVLDLHPTFSNVSTMFPRLYTICLRIMQEEISAFADPRDLDSLQSDDNKVDKFKQPSKNIAVDNISSFIAIIHVNSNSKSEKIPNCKNSSQIQCLVDDIVEEFYKLEELIALYNKYMGRHLVNQILLQIVTILTFTFLCFIWGATGHWEIIGLAIFPIVLYFTELHVLASTGNDLSEAGIQLLNSLYYVPAEMITEDGRAKLELLAIKLATSPPQLQPCNYFTLNKRLITSILSALTTYLIVLVQFQTADIGKRG